jgi:hypothetical protein
LASPNVWPNAFSLVGPQAVLNGQNYLSGSVFFVDSTSSTASDANAGTEPELPKATWTSAYTAAAAGDFIICAAGHSEIISAANTLATVGVTTIGLGVGTLIPRFTSNVAGAMWSTTGAYQKFFNLYFPASTAATTSRLTLSTGPAVVNGCYFECGVNDTGAALIVSSADARVESCSFVATASRPARGIQIPSAVAGGTFKDLLFDGGSYGWTSTAFQIANSTTRMWLENIRLANRSDMIANVTGTSYQMLGVRTLDNTGCRIVIAA